MPDNPEIDRVLADRAAKQGRKRAVHPACVGAGQVGARDQGVGNKRAPLIGPPLLFHSIVLPSGVFSLARGTSSSTRRPAGRSLLGQTHWVVEVLGVSWAWFDAWVRGPAVGGRIVRTSGTEPSTRGPRSHCRYGNWTSPLTFLSGRRHR